MADEQDWVDVPAKKGAGTAVADDDWQDVAPAKAASHASAMPSGSYQNRKGGPILNANDSSAHAAVRGLEGTLGINKEPTSFGDALGQSASSLGHLGLSVLKDPLNAGKAVEGIATGLEDAGRDVYQGLKHHDPRSVAHGTGAVAGILGPEVSGAKRVEPVAQSITESAARAKPAIGLALRTEKGTIRPSVATVGRVVGTGLGLAAGHATGFPGAADAGGLLGALGGYRLADALTPERPFDIPTRGNEPGAPMPLAEDFYEQRGKDLTTRGRQQSILDRRPGEKPVDVNPGAPLPSTDEFYENRGEDLMARGRQQSILDRAAAKPRTTPFGSGITSEGVSVYPEPREPLPEDRPGAMWSIKRKSILPGAAMRGAPGAGDVLRNLGQPIIYTPREGVGYPGPKSITEEGSAAQQEVAPRSIAEPERRVNGGKPPEGMPERRGFYDTHKANVGPTPGEELEQKMREARAEKPTGMTEGDALQRIMKDPATYEKYKAADQKTRDRMLVAASRQ